MNKLLGILIFLVAFSMYIYEIHVMPKLQLNFCKGFLSYQVECLECYTGNFYTSSKTAGEFVGTKPSNITCNSTQIHCYVK